MAEYTNRPYTKRILTCWREVDDAAFFGFLENTFYERNRGRKDSKG